MHPIYFFALVTTLVGGLVLWTMFASWRGKGLATLGFFVVSALNFYSGAELMGTAKPRYLELRDLQGSRIVTYWWVENIAVYVVLLVDGKPKMFQLPWDLKQAEEMNLKMKDLRMGKPMFFNDNKEDPNGKDADAIYTKKKVLPPKVEGPATDRPYGYYEDPRGPQRPNGAPPRPKDHY